MGNGNIDGTLMDKVFVSPPNPSWGTGTWFKGADGKWRFDS